MYSLHQGKTSRGVSSPAGSHYLGPRGLWRHKTTSLGKSADRLCPGEDTYVTQAGGHKAVGQFMTLVGKPKGKDDRGPIGSALALDRVGMSETGVGPAGINVSKTIITLI